MALTQVQLFVDLGKKIRLLETPTVLAVDGRSASGKSTFATRLSSELNAPIVHSDDLAWHHSFFDWWPLLLEQIIVPFRAGRAIDWKPEAWTAQSREGSIVVRQSPILILEGVSVTRQELSEHIDLPIWVETDMHIAETRGLERDGPDGRDFWFEWQASEKPFLEHDKPWDRAKLIVDGAPSLEHDPNTEFVTIKNGSAQRLV
jgi:uridine kinase